MRCGVARPEAALAHRLQRAPLREEKAGGRGLPGIKFIINDKPLQAVIYGAHPRPRGRVVTGQGPQGTPAPFPQNRPRRLRRDAFTRRLGRENAVSVNDLIYPVFVHCSIHAKLFNW
eukprot:gene602-795_t